MELFVVHHVHETAGTDEIKLIGLYSTQARAEEAVDRLSLKPGFRAAPDAFHIDRYRVDEDYWREGFLTGVGPRLSSPSGRNA